MTQAKVTKSSVAVSRFILPTWDGDPRPVGLSICNFHPGVSAHSGDRW